MNPIGMWTAGSALYSNDSCPNFRRLCELALVLQVRKSYPCDTPNGKVSPSLPPLEVDSGLSCEALRKGSAVAGASRRDA
jgi:hypothetical protein